MGRDLSFSSILGYNTFIHFVSETKNTFQVQGADSLKDYIAQLVDHVCVDITRLEIVQDNFYEDYGGDVFSNLTFDQALHVSNSKSRWKIYGSIHLEDVVETLLWIQ